MTETAAPAPARAPPSAWSPLQNGLFRSLWIATIVSNVGTWMQDVGSGWLMTSLSSSPFMVALVEAADSIPMMLLAMPAGALADIVDRRRLLIAVQAYLLVVAGALGILTLLDMTTAWVLLGFTFALGVGAAVMMPAWSAIVPDLVPAEELSSAVALNSVAINASRAIGPALAGVLVAAVGAWLVFILNALSYLGILAVLVRWRREHHKSSLPAERFFSAIRVGLRFVMHTQVLQIVLIRGIAFFLFASATWSLFPLIVRRELGRGPETYGLLLTCIGVGAVAGAMLLPRLRAIVSRDLLVAGASALYAFAALALAHVQNLALLAIAMLATGVAWISILSALQVTAQMTLPPWVRARTRRICRRLHGRNVARQHLVGTSRHAHRHSRCIDGGRRWHGRRDWSHVAFQARPSPGARFHAVDGLAAAHPGRDAGARRAGDGDDPVPYPARQARAVRRSDARCARDAPAQRRLFLAALSRLRRPYALHRMLHGRILGRASAPARARERGGS